MSCWSQIKIPAWWVVLGLSLLQGCADSEALQDTGHDPWSSEQEVVFQLREVIKYEQDRQHQEKARLQSLGVESE
ncbi:MAG: hypothetical protein DIZ78_17220 [endosymbiont of Escarpia spicata]|uniref:Uncharacterized protein n=1 Tax=endosymbiont of Escarpia spicata TaxID=2200908 RepID=A0A370DB85_9GAMM|nr:MAG: hypothetical protein DIZ78_17220 [endosymbiont of Escarpia spicata]